MTDQTSMSKQGGYHVQMLIPTICIPLFTHTHIYTHDALLEIMKKYVDDA